MRPNNPQRITTNMRDLISQARFCGDLPAGGNVKNDTSPLLCAAIRYEIASLIQSPPLQKHITLRSAGLRPFQFPSGAMIAFNGQFDAASIWTAPEFQRRYTFVMSDVSHLQDDRAGGQGSI
jgi:hypothetical protein